MTRYIGIDVGGNGAERRIAKPAHPLWIATTFLFSYLFNLAGAAVGTLWMPDFLALTLIYWTIRNPRHVGMSVAFVCGILMDIHYGTVLGQQALAYVILCYCAYSLHRRLPWFGPFGQAFHILPLLLVAQIIVLLIRLWFDGLWPGMPWFLQSFTGAACWPLLTVIFSLPERRSEKENAL